MNKIFLLSTGLLLGLTHWLCAQQPQFTRISTNEGLSQNQINAILKDSKGFMWFGTDEGLNKYDGYEFFVYKHHPEIETSLLGNSIFDIMEDKSGKIWIGSQNGLDKFDRNRDVFTHYLRGISIRDIFQDSKRHIWLGTTTGLYLLNEKTGTFSHFKHTTSAKSGLSDNTVFRITEDDQSNLWIATQNGLNKLNLNSGKFTTYYHEPRNPRSLTTNTVRCIFRARDNSIWAGMLGGGIAHYNKTSDDFDIFLHDEKKPNSLRNNDILSMVQAVNGDIWVGTENGGVSVYHQRSNDFSTIANNILDEKSLSSNSIYSLYKDDINNIWVGTYSGGINFMPASGNKFKLYRHSIVGNSLSSNIVLSIKGDSDGKIWLGTDGGGLNKFDPETGRFTVYTAQEKVGNSPKSNYVISLEYLKKNKFVLGYHRNGIDIFDSKQNSFWHCRPVNKNSVFLDASVIGFFAEEDNNCWIGTWTQGVYLYNTATNRIKQYQHDPDNLATICDNSVNCIYKDHKGSVWFGTKNGLDCLNPATGSLFHFRHNDRVKSSISSNTINFLLDDTPDKLWIGTAAGLCLLDKKTRTSIVISEKNGLANNVIKSLIKDKKGNLWISTNKGISKYNPVTKAIRNYDISDGLQGSDFKVRASYESANGELYFGGVNGFNVFHPDSIRDNAFIPPVYLVDFQIFNKPVHVGEPDSPLTEHISVTKAITLTHDQGVFSFGFAALNYTLPQKNQYAYKLEGFDKDWNNAGTKRTATYTNLDAGEYVFRVKGSNNDGIWNEEGVALTVRILPPYWATWWFRLAMVVLLTGTAYLFYQGRMNRVQAQKWVLEQLVEERTERLHREQVLNKMKSQFISTASHEFRTPLATIQSSIDLVDRYLDFPPENGKPLIHKHLRIVEKEIGKFGDLLEDVLTIEKMNAGKVRFNPKPVDLTAVCDDVIATHFQGRSDERRVEVSVCGLPRPVLLDERLMGQALVNLLSNAFKFSATNPGLCIGYGENQLSIAVSDRGIGIPAKDLPHLFETFFRAGNVHTIQGTGLGLFITRQAVDLHGGSIEVQSHESIGTTFTVTLPT